jgi:hypothetical protein
MSKRVPSGPSPRETGRTIQFAVRIPKDLLAELEPYGPIAAQLIEGLRLLVERRKALTS